MFNHLCATITDLNGNRPLLPHTTTTRHEGRVSLFYDSGPCQNEENVLIKALPAKISNGAHKEILQADSESFYHK